MTWFKVDDSFHGHPKVLGLSDAAVALWLKAGTWLRSLGYRERVAHELVAAGLWRTLHDGWLFHDWDEYQPSRAQVLAEREAARKRQERARHKSRDRSSGRFSVIDGGAVTGDVTPRLTP